MQIDEKESHHHFANHYNRELDFHPEGLQNVVIEWCENCVSGSVNPATRRDTRKYEYRVRAVREHTRHILMDTVDYITSKKAHDVVNKFIAAQKEMDSRLFKK